MSVNDPRLREEVRRFCIAVSVCYMLTLPGLFSPIFAVLALALAWFGVAHPADPSAHEPKWVGLQEVDAMAASAARDLGRTLGLQLREAGEQLEAAAEALKRRGHGQDALRAHLAAKRARERAQAVLGG